MGDIILANGTDYGRCVILANDSEIGVREEVYKRFMIDFPEAVAIRLNAQLHLNQRIDEIGYLGIGQRITHSDIQPLNIARDIMYCLGEEAFVSKDNSGTVLHLPD